MSFPQTVDPKLERVFYYEQFYKRFQTKRFQTMLPLEEIFTWSDWQPLHNCWLGDAIIKQPGLYRIRRTDQETLDYIGQTGTGSMTLRKRLAMLSGVYGQEMPYRDPHTAAPALWSLRHQFGCDFEVSVLPVEGTTPWRLGLETLAISLYRQIAGQSPTANFGRMPRGYSMSSGNNAKLVQAERRFRGQQVLEDSVNHLPGIRPTGELDANPTGINWCGHHWSEWTALDQIDQQIDRYDFGLYRIRGRETKGLVYIGQGKLRTRLKHHHQKAILSISPQGAIFNQAEPLKCSWVQNNDWCSHQRLELENDLLAAHILHLAAIPSAQFLG